MKATIELKLNGKKTEIELTTEQAKQLGLIEKYETGWERVNNKENYFTIDISRINSIEESNHNYDLKLYDQANYFSTKEKAEQIDKIQTLYRKMKRFSDEHNAVALNWNNTMDFKYFIKYDQRQNEFFVECNTELKMPFVIYFYDRKIAEMALDTFKDDLYEIINLI